MILYDYRCMVCSLFHTHTHTLSLFHSFSFTLSVTHIHSLTLSLSLSPPSLLLPLLPSSSQSPACVPQLSITYFDKPALRKGNPAFLCIYIYIYIYMYKEHNLLCTHTYTHAYKCTLLCARADLPHFVCIHTRAYTCIQTNVTHRSRAILVLFNLSLCMFLRQRVGNLAANLERASNWSVWTQD